MGTREWQPLPARPPALPASTIPASRERSPPKVPAASSANADLSESGARYLRQLDVQQQLLAELRAEWKAMTAKPLPGWQNAVRTAERTTQMRWKGPPAAVLIVPDNGNGFICPEGRCDGRFEGMRIVTGDSTHTDTVVVAVILLAESMRMSSEVWQHELTHALLAQHGMIAESMRHDARYFIRTEFRNGSDLH